MDFCYYGFKYKCAHPLYDECTLYLINNKGLAVVQQRFKDKTTYWTSIDDYLVDDIYLHKGFIEYFNRYAKINDKGLYPTVTVRQIMWALKMKPLKREFWETSFYGSPIY